MNTNLRYTTIHHDVRIAFKLTLCDYMVADSIHQLSHQRVCERSNVDIAEFLGIDEKSVRRAKVSLEEKGLIEPRNGGVVTTEKWYNAAVFAQSGGDSLGKMPSNSAKCRDIRQNADCSIYNNNKNTNSDALDRASGVSSSLEEDSDEPPIVEHRHLDEYGMPVETPPPKAPKLDKVGPVFALWGNYPANWKLRKAQRQAALNLLSERGIDSVKRALRFYDENKDNKFCPVINSPYDLDSKWADLATFKRKNEL